MRIRFLLGPAGSGKTFRCLAEIQRTLMATPDGPPLILLAPKQATFQLERQLLSHPGLGGYARLQILSFDRLAEFVLERLGQSLPVLLAEDGRVMVLRALLSREHHGLKIFQSSARMPGFARQLSELLRDFQRHRIGTRKLESLANERGFPRALSAKLHDVARLQDAYSAWLDRHGLQDGDRLLDIAADILDRWDGGDGSPLASALWLDGFAEMTPQEMHLLEAVTRRTTESTLAFCLDQAPAEQAAWFSAWGTISETFRKCHARLESLPGAECHVELLERDPAHDRFGNNAVLRHVETHFARPRPTAWGSALKSTGRGAASGRWENTEFDFETPDWRRALAVYECRDIEAEATAAALEIRRHVRAGGRYREIAVLCRTLDTVAPVYRRVFRRHHIPCFIDQRAPVGHHPLAELTRGVLRTLAFGWQMEDWFSVVKSGLVGLQDWEADTLENEALANGWGVGFWQKEPTPETASEWEPYRERLATPVLQLRELLGNAPTGAQLARGLRELWQRFRVDETLCDWDAEEIHDRNRIAEAGTRHATIGRQLDAWLEEVSRAFHAESLALPQWIPIIESALGSLTVGLVPPALDQVLLGAIDRSRNPDLRLVILPGWNDGVFPARPPQLVLLSEMDREALAGAGVGLGPLPFARLGHERFYAYIALTRARDRVVITTSLSDAEGTALTPSPFLTHLRRLFPELARESFDVERAETELTGGTKPSGRSGGWMRSASPLVGGEQLESSIAGALYGDQLYTSVSRLEQFASCPFQHFASAGLRLGERRHFELDPRERGSFQHEILARVHQSVVTQGPGWRQLTEIEARQRVRDISAQVAAEFRHGLGQHTGSNRFVTRHLARQLEELIVEFVQWLPGYAPDPSFVELAFGSKDAALPAWTLPLTHGRTLRIRGKVDRVDLLSVSPGEPPVAFIFDYKSSAQRIDPLLAAHGIQIQLPVYLSVLARLGLPDGRPAAKGGFGYVSLKPSANRMKQRPRDAAKAGKESRYDIRGCFTTARYMALKSANQGALPTPFRIKLKKDGQPYKTSDLMEQTAFEQLLEALPALLQEFGEAILGGDCAVAPYQDPRGQTPCERCAFASVCRIDPNQFPFRALKASVD